MTTFVGDFPCRVDAKGRIMLPSVFKKQLSASAQDRFVVRKDVFDKCLVLYPSDEWDRQVKILRSRLNLYKREHSRFLREFFKGTAEILLDGNNRMLIPRRLLELIDVDKEVILAGQDGRIEIWNKGLYEKEGISEEDFADQAEKLLGDSLNIPEE